MGLFSPKCNLLGNLPFLVLIRTQLQYVMGGTLHLSNIRQVQYHLSPHTVAKLRHFHTIIRSITTAGGETSPLSHYNPQYNNCGTV